MAPCINSRVSTNSLIVQFFIYFSDFQTKKIGKLWFGTFLRVRSAIIAIGLVPWQSNTHRKTSFYRKYYAESPVLPDLILHFFLLFTLWAPRLRHKSEKTVPGLCCVPIFLVKSLGFVRKRPVKLRGYFCTHFPVGFAVGFSV